MGIFQSKSSNDQYPTEYAELLNAVDPQSDLKTVLETSSFEAFERWLHNTNQDSSKLLIRLLQDLNHTMSSIKKRGQTQKELRSLWEQHFASSVETSSELYKILSNVENPLAKISQYACYDQDSVQLRKDAVSALSAIHSEAYILLEDLYNDFIDTAAFAQSGNQKKNCLGLFHLSPRKKAYILDLIAFFICGLINNFGYVVMLSAADHIGGKLPESAVLLADILPTFIIKMTAPFFMDRISYNIRISLAILFGLISFQLVAWGPSSGIKILGVICASISSGLGEITFLALSSFYHRNVVSSWSSGTGAAGIVGATWYLAFTAWFTGIPTANRPFVAMIACSGMPLFMAIAYFWMMSPLKSPAQTSESSDDFGSASSINYMVSERLEENLKLQEDEEEDSSGDGLTETKRADPRNTDESLHSLQLGADSYLESNLESLGQEKPLTLKERAKMIPTLLWYILPLLLVYFGEYLINQGVAPSLVWPGTPIRCFEYRYYQFLYQGGVFLSRSSVNFFRIKNIWWLPLLQILNLNVLTLQAIYNFIPYYWIVFLIVIFEGLLGGATYVNVYYALSTETTGLVREYSMSMTSVSDSIGISLAALVGLKLGPFLKLINASRLQTGNCTH